MTAHPKYIDHGCFDAWSAARLVDFGCGASATPKALGMSPYGGPWAVWAAHHAPHLLGKVGGFVRDGADLESAVVRIFARREGLDLHHHEYGIYYHPEHPWVRFSPDATSGPLEAPEHHYEVKVVFSPAVAPILPESGPMPLDRFPVPHWPYQALHQLAACPTLRAVTIVTFLPWFEIRTYTLSRDNAFTVKAMRHVMNKMRRWRDRHLVGGEEPPMDDSEICARWVDWTNPAPDDWGKPDDRPRIVATAEQAAMAYAYAEAKAAQERAKSALSELRSKIIRSAEDTYRLDLTCGGSVQRTSLKHRKV